MNKKSFILALTATILCFNSLATLAEPISGTYKLVSETITNPDPACPSIYNSGIYFGDGSFVNLKYDQGTHMVILNDVDTSVSISLAPTRAGRYELNFNRPTLQGKITMIVTTPITGNSFEIISFSELTSGTASQKCSSIAEFSLSSQS